MFVRLFFILTFTFCFRSIPFTMEQTTGFQQQTTNKAEYLDQFENQVIIELNKVRLNPAKYAEDKLARLVHNYDGKLLNIDGKIPIRTQEGKKALLDCLRDMKQAKPLPPLSPSQGLSQVAQILLKEQQRSGRIGHIGNRGSTPQSRVEKIGTWTGELSENITYGNDSPQMVVINLLIDDGVPNRGHRKNILNPKFNEVGIAAGSHPKYKQMCVMEMAGGFQKKEP